jgi:porin
MTSSAAPGFLAVLLATLLPLSPPAGARSPQDEGQDEAAEEAATETDAPAFDASPYLFGDWGGARADLAGSGITLDIQWTQSAQGVVSGGGDTGWEYGASVDFLTTLDLGKMDVLPGGYVRLMAQGRYGDSVNPTAGAVLPVNTDLFFPVTREVDDDVLAITELSYLQFLSPHFGFVVGKLQTLDGDPNEFAGGRGRSQFMNFNFVAPNLGALAVPYGTLGGGLLIHPNEHVGISTSFFNTTEASTTTGFGDIGDGVTWSTEVQFQYRLGDLPGGQNVGFAYAFDNEFRNVGGAELIDGLITPIDEDETWVLYWSVWQYLLTLDDAPARINAGDGRPDVRGLGLFARASVADEDTNIVELSASIGIGGRGLIPSRDEDVFGVAFGYAALNDDAPVAPHLIDDEGYGVEAFYNAMLAPGVRLTGDIQVFESPISGDNTSVITGLRLNIRF